MKKTLSAVLAATMLLSMSATAFAATSVLEVTDEAGTDGSSYLILDKLTDVDKYTSAFDNGDEFKTGAKIYNYDGKDHKIYVVVEEGGDLRADVDGGDIKVTEKRVETDLSPNEVAYFLGDGTNAPAGWKGSYILDPSYKGSSSEEDQFDIYEVKVTSTAPLRTFKLLDWTIELDYDNDSYFVKGQNAYSAIRDVEEGERYTIKKTAKGDDLRSDSGSIFEFDAALDDDVRINAHDYVDLFFDGNYGTDTENLRVLTDKIADIEDYFEDIDVDYYDFVARPKFASDVEVRIDADPNAFIYEYDKETGDITDITDDCDYDSDGYSFETKELLTYVIAEEEYVGGNVDEEEVEDDDVEEPVEVEEPAAKPNPGTGAF